MKVLVITMVAWGFVCAIGLWSTGVPIERGDALFVTLLAWVVGGFPLVIVLVDY